MGVRSDGPTGPYCLDFHPTIVPHSLTTSQWQDRRTLKAMVAAFICLSSPISPSLDCEQCWELGSSSWPSHSESMTAQTLRPFRFHPPLS